MRQLLGRERTGSFRIDKRVKRNFSKRPSAAKRLPTVPTSALNDEVPFSVGVRSGPSILRGTSAIGVEDVCCDLPLAVYVLPDHNVLTNVFHGAIGASERQQIGPLIESHVAT